MYRSTIILIFLFAFASSVFGQTINATSSKVMFEISNFTINTVSGTFSGMSGTINFNPADSENSKFEVCIDANSIKSGINKRDEDLKAKEYFDVNQYPTICFTSSSVEINGTGFLAKGALTLRGVTKQIEIPFSYVNHTLTGEFTIKRLDYKIGADTGSFFMGKKIEIEIKCVLN